MTAEKNLKVLRKVMEEIPEARLAFVGDGPSRAELEEHFKDMDNVKFMVRRGPRYFVNFLPHAQAFAYISEIGKEMCSGAKRPL